MADQPDNFDSTLWEAVDAADISELHDALTTHGHLIDTPHPRRENRTPMHRAAATGRVQALQTLVRFGTQAIDALDNNGFAPIFAAGANGHVSAIEALVQLGSKAIDTPNNDGLTIMHVSVMFDRTNVIEALFRLGSKATDIPTAYGKTPLQLAIEWERPSCAKLLKALSADPTSELIVEEHEVTLTEDEVVALRYGVYFDKSLVHRLLFEAERLSLTRPLSS